ncbi:hypothetical protein PENTCL1PPCAC_5510, partial [Pristionchus entomophagus]
SRNAFIHKKMLSKVKGKARERSNRPRLSSDSYTDVVQASDGGGNQRRARGEIRISIYGAGDLLLLLLILVLFLFLNLGGLGRLLLLRCGLLYLLLLLLDLLLLPLLLLSSLLGPLGLAVLLLLQRNLLDRILLLHDLQVRSEVSLGRGLGVSLACHLLELVVVLGDLLEGGLGVFSSQVIDFNVHVVDLVLVGNDGGVDVVFLGLELPDLLEELVVDGLELAFVFDAVDLGKGNGAVLESLLSLLLLGQLLSLEVLSGLGHQQLSELLLSLGRKESLLGLLSGLAGLLETLAHLGLLALALLGLALGLISIVVSHRAGGF